LAAALSPTPSLASRATAWMALVALPKTKAITTTATAHGATGRPDAGRDGRLCRGHATRARVRRPHERANPSHDQHGDGPDNGDRYLGSMELRFRRHFAADEQREVATDEHQNRDDPSSYLGALSGKGDRPSSEKRNNKKTGNYRQSFAGRSQKVVAQGREGVCGGPLREYMDTVREPNAGAPSSMCEGSRRAPRWRHKRTQNAGDQATDNAPIGGRHEERDARNRNQDNPDVPKRAREGNASGHREHADPTGSTLGHPRQKAERCE